MMMMMMMIALWCRKIDEKDDRNVNTNKFFHFFKKGYMFFGRFLVWPHTNGELQTHTHNIGRRDVKIKTTDKHAKNKFSENNNIIPCHHTILLGVEKCRS